MAKANTGLVCILTPGGDGATRHPGVLPMATVVVPQGVGRAVRQTRFRSATGQLVQPDLGPCCPRPKVSAAEGLHLGSVNVLGRWLYRNLRQVLLLYYRQAGIREKLG